MARCVPEPVLSRYLDGDLPCRRTEAVAEHLAKCPLCQAALNRLRRVDRLVRNAADAWADRPVPDVAETVTDDLRRRGAFFTARVTHAKRQLVGDRGPPGRVAAVLSVAASIVVFALMGLTHVTRSDWARRTAPVLDEAERVAVRFVYVDPAERADTRARAREASRELALADRLGEAQTGASPALAAEFEYLERAFAALAGNDDLPLDLETDLARGAVTARIVRLREDVAGGQ